MKRFKSLIIAVVAVFMLGIPTVFAAEPAEDIIVEKSTTWYDGTYDNRYWAAYVKYAKDANGSKRYAFCLESEENVVFDQLSINSEWKNAKANAIITKAYQLGFGTGHNNYGVNDVQFYGITQSAIWNAVNGEGKNGYYGRYQQWINGTNKNDNNYGKNYSKLFNELMSASNVSYSVKITGDTTMKKDGDFLVSGDLKVEATNVPSNAKFIITLSNIEGGKNGSAGIATNGSNWNHTQTVSNGETVKVRMPIIEGHQNYSVQLNVESSFEGEYVIYNYPTSKGQDIGVAIPAISSVKDEVIVTGTYTKTKTGNLIVSKDSSTGQKEIPGAQMKVYGCEEGNDTCSWTSEEGKTHEIENLTIGKVYKLEETTSPKGFDPLTVNIYFKLIEGGKTQLCNVKNDDIENALCSNEIEIKDGDKTIAKIDGEVLVIVNYPSKNTKTSLTISKRDYITGKEISGAHLQIFRIVDGKREDKPTFEWDSTKEDYIIKNIEPGEYILVETMSAPNYDSGMIILGNLISEYKFEIVEGQMAKIDVYNKLKEQRIEVPNTGITTSAYIIGSLVMLVGAGTVFIAKKKENI